jgi:hypothetical protein
MIKRVPEKDTDRNGGLAYGEQWQRCRVAGTLEDPKVGVGGSGVEMSKVGVRAEIAFVGRRLRM